MNHSHATPQTPHQATRAGFHASPELPYQPDFFNSHEWRQLQVLCDRLLPLNPLASLPASQIMEFIDRHMHTPYAHASVPVLPRAKLPIRDLLRSGMRALDEHCQHYLDTRFAELSPGRQSNLLQSLACGLLVLEGVSGQAWYHQLLGEIHLACLCLAHERTGLASTAGPAVLLG